MVKLVDALYHRRRGQQLLDGVLDPHGWVKDGEGVVVAAVDWLAFAAAARH